MFNCRFELSSDKLQNVSQSVSVSSLETVCLTLMLNQDFKAFAGTCQQFFVDVVKISNIVGFRISQGSVATYASGGNVCGMHIEIFLYELIGERIFKICPHLPNIKWLLFERL